MRLTQTLTKRDTWKHWLYGLVASCVKSGATTVRAMPGLAVLSAGQNGMSGHAVGQLLWSAALVFGGAAIWALFDYLKDRPLPELEDEDAGATP